MEPEFWAETGRIDPTEQHETDVVKNSIFSIAPKAGVLGPGEKTMLKLSYSHEYLGTNRLPVLLKINRGREIMVRRKKNEEQRLHTVKKCFFLPRSLTS